MAAQQALEIAEALGLRECIQCGMCTGSCPVSIKLPLNVRRIVRQIGLFYELPLEPVEVLWACTTCGTCELRCPKELKPFEAVISLRSVLVEEGRIARTLIEALESAYTHGNPWGRGRAKRLEWAEGLSFKLKLAGEGAEWLYFVGCTPAYDTRAQEVARALAELLHMAGLDFAVLGKEETCCGNEIYSMGEKGLFEELRDANLALFEELGVERVVTPCPHGFNALRNLYNGRVPNVLHHSQLLSALLDEGKLKPEHELKLRVIYHDPCFLGKRNGIFDEPRHVIEAIPGVELLEFERSRTRSLCCEGGGGRMWVDVPGEKLAERRAREAAEVGADVIAVACPFCLVTLEDAVKTTGLEERLKVMDIAELLLASIKPQGT